MGKEKRVVVTSTPPSVPPGHQKVHVAFESESERVKVQWRSARVFGFVLARSCET